MTANRIREELDERFALILPVFAAIVGALFLILTVRDVALGGLVK